MHMPTHFLMSWTVANAPKLERRDRTIVTVAGIIPDLDALGAIGEIATRGSEQQVHWFADYHHVLCHNLGFALLTAVAALAIAKRRVVTALVAFGAFHLHLVCDIIGARGPDGSQWPIPYLLPFSDALELKWSYQWPLSGWQNMTITGVLIVVSFYLAWRRGFSFVGIFSKRADDGFVSALRKRFGEPTSSSG